MPQLRLILLLLLILLFSIIIIRLFSSKAKEGFQQQTQTIPPELEQQYQGFIKFYGPFTQRWEQAIQTYIATQTTQAPLSSPSDVSKIDPTKQPSPADTLMLNIFIKQIATSQGNNLPQINSFTFPSSLSSATPLQLVELAQEIPTDSQPYINALNWMNSKMDKSHKNLQKALQGNYIPSNEDNEGFQNQSESQCQQLEQCKSELTSLINQQIQEQQQQPNSEEVQSSLNMIQQKLQQFSVNKQSLQKAWELNNILFEKSNKLQEQAQNGELLKQVDIKDGHYYAPYQIPDGGNILGEMEQNNPTRYNELKNNYSQFFHIKKLIEEINSKL